MKWSSPTKFYNSVNNHGYDTDGVFGAQCWDGGDYFWYNQVGRRLMTKPGGNGVARQCWEVSRYYNAGTEFDLITEVSKLLPGDWTIFGGTVAGHIGMAVSKDLGNYVRLLGQNQGGIPYKSGGANFNVINMSLNNFLGAFRLKVWHEGEKPVKPTKSEIGDAFNYLGISDKDVSDKDYKFYGSKREKVLYTKVLADLYKKFKAEQAAKEAAQKKLADSANSEYVPINQPVYIKKK